MKQKTRQITMVNLSDIVAAGFNPPDRVERKNLAELRSRIVQAGEIINPVVLSRDLRIIDGHRRCAVADDLQWPAIPALVVEYGLQEGWAILNGGTRPITAGDWMAAASRGMDTRYMPDRHAKKIERLRELIDNEGLTMLAERKKSTWLLTLAEKVSKMLGDESDEYLADVVRWLATHNMQYAARKAMEDGDLEALSFAIAHDQPIERT